MNSKVLFGIVAGIVIILFVLVFVVNTNPSGTAGSGNGDISLLTNPNPARTGKTTLIVSVKDKDGKSVDNAKVNFTLNMTSMNMGTQQGSATSQGNGQYAADGNFSMGGPWKISTQVTMPDGTNENKDFDINVQ